MKIHLVLILLIYGALVTTGFAQASKKKLTIPSVTYCDLIAKPLFYDQKELKITALYLVAFEGSLMYGRGACGQKQTWVEFDVSAQGTTEPKVWRNFEHLTDTTPERTPNGGVNYPSRIVQVIWIGTFQGMKRTQKIGPKTYGLGYGHMNGFDFQFTVKKIEQVKKM